MGHDLRHAARLLIRDPSFTVLCLLSLLVGIGVNVAMFSVVNALVLRDPPYEDPARLVAVWERDVAERGRQLTSTPNLLDWLQRQQVFTRLAGTSAAGRMTLIDDSGPLRILTGGVSRDYFDLLGVRPWRGVGFSSENHVRGKHFVVLISYAFWRDRYSEDPRIVGRAVRLNDRPYTIIGVMPEDYRHPVWTDGAVQPAAWIPVDLPLYQNDRGYDWLLVIGRLKAGVTVMQARDEMARIGRELATLHPDTNGRYEIETVPLKDALTGDTKQGVWLLFGSVFLLLLITCANVTNLSIARNAGRAREMVTRLALGSSRFQLFRCLMLESLVLSILGGLAGLVAGTWALKVIVARVDVPALGAHQVELNGGMLLFTWGMSLVASVVSGLVPAIQTARLGPATVLRMADSRVTGGSWAARLRKTLVGAQVVAATVLLISAFLLVQSLRQVLAVDLGFDPSRIVTADVELPIQRSSSENLTAPFLLSLLARVGGIPGVESVGAVSAVPLGPGDAHASEREIHVPGASGAHKAKLTVSTPDYFRAASIALLDGRSFTAEDTWDAPRIAIVNEVLANSYYAIGRAVGQSISISGEVVRIVGVAATVRSRDVVSQPGAEVFVPHAQRPWASMTLVVRTSVNAGTIGATLTRILREMDPDRPLSSVKTGRMLVSDAAAGRTLSVLLVSAFAVFAVGVSLLGLYGITTRSVLQRRAEIALRMAMGATRQRVVRLVVMDAVTVTTAGVFVGLLLSFAVTRLFASLLYEVSPFSLGVHLGVVATFVCVVVIAAAVPVVRATRGELFAVLRYE